MKHVIHEVHEKERKERRGRNWRVVLGSKVDDLQVRPPSVGAEPGDLTRGRWRISSTWVERLNKRSGTKRREERK